jgi:hypothetical protein
MKKLLLFISINIIITLMFIQNLNAQSIEDLNVGISVSPAIVDLKEGESYTLNIFNKTTTEYSFVIEPALFTFDERGEKIVPFTDEQFLNNIDLSSYISVETSTGTLGPNGIANIKINYVKKFPDYLSGVWIKESRPDLPGVGIGNNIASVVLDYSLNAEEVGNILTDLDINSTLSVSGLNFGKTFKITSIVNSDLNKILKANGEISISDNSTKISNISLTQKLPSNIYPNESVEVESQFQDSRNFLKRFGKVTIEQRLTINGEIYSVTKEVLVIPFELMGVVLVMILILFIAYKVIKKRKGGKVSFKKEMVRKRVGYNNS